MTGEGNCAILLGGESDKDTPCASPRIFLTVVAVDLQKRIGVRGRDEAVMTNAKVSYNNL